MNFYFNFRFITLSWTTKACKVHCKTINFIGLCLYFILCIDKPLFTRIYRCLVLAGKLFSRKNRLWFQDCTVYLRAWSWFPISTSNLHQINFTSGLGLIIFCLNQSKQKYLWYTANSCLCKSYGRRIVKIMYGE